jgi:putative ABC transport system permease protein
MDTQLPVLGAAPLAWAGLMAGAAVLGAVAGVYPAWGVARRSVPSLFEGSSFGRGQGLTVRRGLVVAQFALLIALGSTAVLMQQQMTFLQSQDLGFRPSGLVEITNGGALTSSADPDRSYLDRRTVSQSQAFQRELARSPLVEAVTSGRTFLSEQQSGPQFRRDANPSAPAFRATWSALNPDAPRVIGLTPKAGAYFDRPLGERRDSVALVNPQALDRLGCDADDLSDCRVYTDWSDRLSGVPVVGVVENARFSSLRYGTDPLILFLFDQTSRRGSGRHDLFVRFRDEVSRDRQAKLIEATWDRFLPGRSVEYEVLAERIDAFYAQDQRLRTLGLSLAGVALVLVVLGLLAITAYLTRLRLKEVAIRKALGASVASILALLNREFVGLVGMAFVLGSTAGYFAMHEWLAGFATRIDVSPVVFLAIGAGALLLSVVAVSAQSLTAVRVDPARVLRSE